MHKIDTFSNAYSCSFNSSVLVYLFFFIFFYVHIMHLCQAATLTRIDLVESCRSNITALHVHTQFCTHTALTLLFDIINSNNYIAYICALHCTTVAWHHQENQEFFFFSFASYYN